MIYKMAVGLHRHPGKSGLDHAGKSEIMVHEPSIAAWSHSGTGVPGNILRAFLHG